MSDEKFQSLPQVSLEKKQFPSINIKLTKKSNEEAEDPNESNQEKLRYISIALNVGPKDSIESMEKRLQQELASMKTLPVVKEANEDEVADEPQEKEEENSNAVMVDPEKMRIVKLLEDVPTYFNLSGYISLSINKSRLVATSIPKDALLSNYPISEDINIEIFV